MALLIGCLALFLAAGYWLMGRVDAFWRAAWSVKLAQNRVMMV